MMMISLTVEHLIPCTYVRSAKSWGIAADLKGTDEDLKDGLTAAKLSSSSIECVPFRNDIK